MTSGTVKRFSFIEKSLIVISIVGLIWTGVHFFESYKVSRPIAVKEDSFGVVKPQGQDVRVRGERENNWNRVQRDANVFQNDRIYTGARSSAIVNLKSKQSLNIEPNSLIILSDNKETINLDIGSGGFLAEIKKGVKLLIKTENTKTEIEGDGSVIQLDAKDKKELKLVVLRGNTKVKNDRGEIKNIVANNEVRISTNNFDVKKLDIEILTPSPGETLWNTGIPINFSWSISSKEKSPVIFELSKDPLFIDSVQKYEVKDYNLRLSKLSESGIYFWRVSDEKQTSSSSPISSFSYYELKAPLVAKESIIAMRTDWQGEVLDLVRFAWDDPSLSSSYKFQLAKDISFSQIIYSEKTPQTGILINQMKIGTYYWRVLSSYEGREDLTSSVGKITINPQEEPQPMAIEPASTIAEVTPQVEVSAPFPVEPLHLKEEKRPLERPVFLKSEFAFELLEKSLSQKSQFEDFALTDKPQLNWNNVDGAEDYEIELSKFEDFREMTVQKVIKSSPFIWDDPEAGQFFVCVRAKRKNEITSDSMSKVRIILTAPQFKSLKFYEKLNTNSNLFLSWKDHPLSTKTEIQISQNKEFEKPITIKTNSRSLNEHLTESGAYFIRARSLSSFDWPISRFSDIEKIERPILLKKEFGFELTEDRFIKKKKVKDFEVVEKPQIKWKTIDDVEGFEVELSKFEDFRELTLQKVTKSSPFTWNKPEVGQFFVRVRAKRKNEFMTEDRSKVRIILMAPQIQSLELSEKPNEPPELVLSWKGHPLSTKTEIQISQNKNFEKPIIIKTNNLSLRQSLTEPGTYYVRVRSLDSADWPISRFSDLEKIEVSPWLTEEAILAEEDLLNPTEANSDSQLNLPKIKIPSLSVWGGLGANYLRFKQAGASDVENGEFSNLVAPTLFTGANIRITKRSYLEFDYHDWPGKITTTAEFQINKTGYNWKSLVGEFQYRFLENDRAYYSLLLGVQIHQIPILSVHTDGYASLFQNELQNGSIGIKATYLGNSNFEYEYFARYQTILSSKSLNGYDFKAQSKFLFDGSVGVSRHFDNGFKAGVYWFGQYQDFKYNFKRDGTLTSGGQTLFNSIIQLRIGWEFYSLLQICLLPQIQQYQRRRWLDFFEKTDKKMKISSIITFWLVMFLTALLAFNFVQRKMKAYQESESQAIILKQMSEKWIAEAGMSNRIYVRNITMSKFQNAITKIHVSLQSHEKLDSIYQQKLIEYIKVKAKVETGKSCQFEFSIPKSYIKPKNVLPK